jgi:hypothetical protein
MSISSYQAGLRSAVRGLYNGALNRSQFTDALKSAIRRGLTQAFIEGAKDCGIKQDELSDKELDTLTEAIESEYEYIGNFGDAIKESEKLAALYSRLDKWTNRYTDIVNRAKVLACADSKLEWELGATEKHCSTCPRLHGKVKRGSQWEKLGIHPQRPPNACLECGGWECKCRLKRTDKVVSRGSLGVSC